MIVFKPHFWNPSDQNQIPYLHELITAVTVRVTAVTAEFFLYKHSFGKFNNYQISLNLVLGSITCQSQSFRTILVEALA
uniref:Uncharacterized protein n=1 Tax=Anguilla anguilla TaxID=7936 RepID=A0A0E9W068_ANGAN